jgi:hypothetical protein
MCGIPVLGFVWLVALGSSISSSMDCSSDLANLGYLAKIVGWQRSQYIAKHVHPMYGWNTTQHFSSFVSNTSGCIAALIIFRWGSLKKVRIPNPWVNHHVPNFQPQIHQTSLSSSQDGVHDLQKVVINHVLVRKNEGHILADYVDWRSPGSQPVGIGH